MTRAGPLALVFITLSEKQNMVQGINKITGLNPGSKLIPSQVQQIRTLYWVHNWTLRRLGEFYNVHHKTIDRIVHYWSWATVEDVFDHKKIHPLRKKSWQELWESEL